MNGHKLSDEEARQQNDKMIRSNLLIRELQDSFMDKIMSGDLTVIAQMIKNNVRPKDWNYLLRKSIYSSYEDNPYVLHISPLYHALIKLTNRYGINTIINYNYDDTFYHALCECGYKFRNHYKNMDTHGDKRIYYSDGSLYSIDCTAVENEVARNMYERSELDDLVYNDPVGYADLVFNGDLESYLRTVTDYKPMDN